MSIFRAVVFAGALAGLAAGLLVSALQAFGTWPLIAQAEVYEKAAEKAPAAHAHTGGPAAAPPAGAPVPEAWEPADGLERTGYTLLFNVVERVGWAFVLAAAMLLSGRPPGWREGLLWGLAGFASVVMAPGLGLPPELPGIPAAPVGLRQAWWIGTAACTASALWLLAFRPRPVWAALAVALMAAPHLVGAPMLAEVATNVPAALSHRFVTAVTLTTFLAWALLGALAGGLLGRFLGPDEVASLRGRPVAA